MPHTGNVLKYKLLSIVMISWNGDWLICDSCYVILQENKNMFVLFSRNYIKQFSRIKLVGVAADFCVMALFLNTDNGKYYFLRKENKYSILYIFTWHLYFCYSAEIDE